MTDRTFVIVARMAAYTRESRDMFLDKLSKIVNDCSYNEPNTLKFAVCLPIKEQSNEIYVIEEFTTVADYYTHHTEPQVKETMKLCAELLDPTRTTAYHLSYLPTAHMWRPDRLPSNATCSNDLRARDKEAYVKQPTVIFANIVADNETAIDALEPFGKAIVDHSLAEEPETIFYADAKSVKMLTEEEAKDGKPLTRGNGKFICAIEAYSSLEACQAHLQGETVQALGDAVERVGAKIGVEMLRMVDGWLVRE